MSIDNIRCTYPCEHQRRKVTQQCNDSKYFIYIIWDLRKCDSNPTRWTKPIRHEQSSQDI